MAATYMLRKHLATIASAGKPEAIRERAIYQEACKRALVDRKEKFSTVTPDNFEEAVRYQDERVAFWKTKLEEEAR